MNRATKLAFLGAVVSTTTMMGCKGSTWTSMRRDKSHLAATTQTHEIASPPSSTTTADPSQSIVNSPTSTRLASHVHDDRATAAPSISLENQGDIRLTSADVTSPDPLALPPETVPSPPTPPVDALAAQSALAIQDALALALQNNKSLVVLGYAPQEVKTFIDSEVAEFDPVLMASMSGGRFDRQISNFLETGGLISTNEQQTDFLTPLERNNLSISKLLESGGTVEAGIGINYLNQDPVGGLIFLNPFWRSAVNLRLTQPLNRGRGRAITLAPLRIAKATHAQSVHELRAQVNVTIRDVQLAYWDYKLAWEEYQVRISAVEDARLVVEREKERLKLDEGTLPDVRQAEDQLQRFLADSLNAKNRMRQAKVTLAQTLGISAAEANFHGARDEPIVDAPYVREEGEVFALSRPELMAFQAQITAAETLVRVAANNLRSDVDLRLDYAVTGLERDLDEALSTTLDHRFNDWIVSLDYRQAVGVRAAYAELRRAKLRLARVFADRERLELDIISDLARTWSELETQKENLEIQQERVQIAKELLGGRTELYEAGEGTLDLQVRAASSLVDAQLAELASRIAVQRAIVNWEYVTGQQSYVELASE